MLKYECKYNFKERKQPNNFIKQITIMQPIYNLLKDEMNEQIILEDNIYHKLHL